MAYNKKKHLSQNIDAIEIVLELDKSKQKATDEQIRILQNYSGFGGIKCILYPIDTPDIKHWGKSDGELYPLVVKLHEIIQKYSHSEREYKKYIDSLRQSVLTAFYTPRSLIDTIASSISDSGIEINSFLEPSAGTGRFIPSFKNNKNNIVAFENDILTGKILSALYPDDDINVKGFEEINRNYENYFDCICSNIPFGNFKVFDPVFMKSSDDVKKRSSNTIHSYFFAKGIDTLRDGGILAFITSQGLMDSHSNEYLREWIVKRCNLVTAVRFPNDLFAEDANTEAPTDLIMLQKNNSKKELSEAENAFINTRHVSDGVYQNSFFNDHHNIIYTQSYIGTNQYGKTAIEHYHDGGLEGINQALSNILASDLKNHFNKELFQHSIQQNTNDENTSARELYRILGITDQQFDQIEKSKTLVNNKPAKDFYGYSERKYTNEDLPFYKKDILVIDNEQAGTLYKDEEGHILFVPLRINYEQFLKLQSYIPLRDSYFNLYQNESKDQIEYPELRADLNQKYKEFTDKYGNLNQKGNTSLFALDSLGMEILSLERFEGGHKKLADIFTIPVNFHNQETEIKSASDALAASLNKTGVVELDYMAEISDIPVEELITDLKGRIYYNPDEGTYETAEAIISGDVSQKKEDFINYTYLNPNDPNIDRCRETIEALERSIPTPIPFEQLDFNFGERWFPIQHFSDYASDLFRTEVDITYLRSTDNFIVNTKETNAIINEKYAVKGKSSKYNGIELLRHALINTTPHITKKVIIDGKEVRIPDVEAIQLADTKIEEIRNGFTDWLNKQSLEFKKELEDLYNSKFNSSYKPVYDGSFQKFPDLQLASLGIQDLYSSQKNTIWKLISNAGGVVDHEMGGGKTLTICVASYEMKRLGIINKPLILGLNSNVHEIADTYQKAYPNARVLFPSADDLTPHNKKRFFHQIKNNNWDAVILTHEQFMKIPQSLDIQKEILTKEIENVVEDLRTLERLRGKAASKKEEEGLIKRQKNLTAKLKLVQIQIAKRRDDIPDFKEMGFDHIFLDESHYFKNLTYTTRYSRVSGLGDQKGSQRALNLLFAIRTIQNDKDKDLCATFLSGTIISNSLVELYLIFKYLRPRALEKRNINTFDSWASVYAKKSTNYEFSVTNELIAKERFRHFIKVPELVSFYHEIADCKSAEDIGLQRPNLNYILKVTPQTPEQKDYSQKLIDFANTGNATLIDRQELSYEEQKAKMLIVTNEARKMTLDMRLVSPTKYHDHPNNKISQAAQNIMQYYHRYNEHKGTQFVFCNLGTFKHNDTKWNVYDALKDKLVQEYRVPEHEIRFIQESRNRDEKKELQQLMNCGDIRIMFGSTQTLGTGVNAQKNAVATHHLEIPWKTTDIEQEDARAARPGNIIAKDYADNTVDSIIYATENTLDIYKFNLLQNKQLFISQIRNGNIASRRIDEGAFDDEGGMNLAEYIAIMTNNSDLLQKAKLEKEIMVLETEQKAFNQNINSTGWNLQRSKQSLNETTIRLSGLEKDWNKLNESAPKNEKGERNLLLSVNGCKDSDGLAIKGEKLLQINNSIDTGSQYMPIGQLGCFPIVVKTESLFGQGLYFKNNRFFIEGSVRYTHNNGILPEDPALIIANFEKALEKIPGIIERYTKEIQKLEKDIPIMEEVVNSTWSKTEKLENLKNELTEIEKKIHNEIYSDNKYTEIAPVEENKQKSKRVGL